MKRHMPAFLFIVVLASLAIAGPGAYALGISPPRITIDFKPGFNSTYIYYVRGEDREMPVGRLIRCDLEQYITTDLPQETVLRAGEVRFFNLSVNLPQRIETPGVHYCRITIYQMPQQGGSGMGAYAGITGQIWITVPYPAKYLVASLQATDVNLTNPVEFTLTLRSMGLENVTARSSLDIIDEFGRSIQKIDMGEAYIPTMAMEHVPAVWHHSGLPPGRYSARATVEYGGDEPSSASTDFKIGDILLRIGNITYPGIYSGDRVVKFQADVESLWNEDIDDAFLTLFVSKDGQTLFEGKSENFLIGAWANVTVPVFWDISGLEEGAYLANFTVYYSGRSSQKAILVEISPPPNDYLMYLIIAAIAAAALIALYLVRKRRRR